MSFSGGGRHVTSGGSQTYIISVFVSEPSSGCKCKITFVESSRILKNPSGSGCPCILFFVNLQCIFSHFSLFFLFLLLILYFKVKSASYCSLNCGQFTLWLETPRGRVRGRVYRTPLSEKTGCHESKICDHSPGTWRLGWGGGLVGTLPTMPSLRPSVRLGVDWTLKWPIDKLGHNSPLQPTSHLLLISLTHLFFPLDMP